MTRPQGVGVGLRRQMFDDIPAISREVDFFELNSPMTWTRRLRTAYQDAAAAVPVVVHSLGLSIGTADPFDEEALAQLVDVSATVDAGWVSEHLSFSAAGNVALTSFIPLPYSAEMVTLVATKARQLQAHLGRPFLLENITHDMRWPNDEMTEAEFIRDILRLADCGALLDVTNLIINAHLFGYDPMSFLQTLDPERIVQLHVAGYTVDKHGKYWDSHVGDIGPDVLALTDWVLRHTACRAVLIERDTDIEGFDDVREDLARVRGVYQAAVL